MSLNTNTVKPKQKRSINSKKAILKAATQIFSHKGLHGARIDEIAELSQVNKQRIYAYFGSKEALYREVLLNVYALAATNKMILSLSEKDIPNMTTIILEIFFDFHKKHPEFWRLLAWENLYNSKSLTNSDWKTLNNSYIAHIEKIYKKGQQNGLINNNISFSTYLIEIFAVTYFYFSNQMTISHLLDVKLDEQRVQSKIIKEINSTFLLGIQENKKQ